MPATAAIGGTTTTGDTITISVFDPALPGGSQAVTYIVGASDTLSTIASGLASSINADTDLQAIGVKATAVRAVVTIRSKSTNATRYRQTTSSSATETVVLSVPGYGFETAAIGGTPTPGDILSITVYDPALPSGKQLITYTVTALDTLATIAAGLASKINGNTNLRSIGINATANSTVVSIRSLSPNLTTYSQLTRANATETITLSRSTSVVRSTVNNVNALVAIAPGGDARFQGSTSKPVKSASVAGQVVTINQKALNGVTFGSSVTGTPTETLCLI